MLTEMLRRAVPATWRVLCVPAAVVVEAVPRSVDTVQCAVTIKSTFTRRLLFFVVAHPPESQPRKRLHCTIGFRISWYCEAVDNADE